MDSAVSQADNAVIARTSLLSPKNTVCSIFDFKVAVAEVLCPLVGQQIIQSQWERIQGMPGRVENVDGHQAPYFRHDHQRRSR